MHKATAATATILAISASLVRAQYTTTWDVNNLPEHSEDEQSGTNRCGLVNHQDSECQTMFVNSLEDWCVWAPPEPNSAIGDTEQIEVAWCTRDGYGTRTIPDGVLTGVHFVQTPDFVQITGVGDFTKMNINGGGGGGELDPHGADGKGNPHGGLVFSNAFGPVQQIHEWTNFMSDQEFCIRVCKPGPNAWLYCNHVFDVMGCEWNMPGDYSAGVFETCQADSGTPMGLYPSGNDPWGSTFSQGQPSTPDAHPAPSSSQCKTVQNLGIGQPAPTAAPQPSSSSSSSSASSSTSNTTVSTSTSSTSSTVLTTRTMTNLTSPHTSTTHSTSTATHSLTRTTSSSSTGTARALNNQAAATHANTSGATSLRASFGVAAAVLAVAAAGVLL